MFPFLFDTKLVLLVLILCSYILCIDICRGWWQCYVRVSLHVIVSCICWRNVSPSEHVSLLAFYNQFSLTWKYTAKCFCNIWLCLYVLFEHPCCWMENIMVYNTYTFVLQLSHLTKILVYHCSHFDVLKKCLLFGMWIDRKCFSLHKGC